MQIQRGGSREKIDVQMTPMIDIVFQLLVFFIMTFKVFTLEGDFNVKMPLTSQGVSESLTPSLKIRLRAGDDGQLAGIVLNDQDFGRDWDGLHQYIVSYLGDDRGPNSLQADAEVELDCDYRLNYEHVIAAITAISGHVDGSNNIVPLIEKTRFAPPRSDPG